MSKRSRSPTVSRFTLVVGIMLALALLLGACAEDEPTEVTRIVEVPGAETEVTRIVEVPTEVEVPGEEVEVTRIVELMVEPEAPAVEIPEQGAILTAWEGSAHGNTYDLGKGPNTYCSRCHSPENWDPESKPGPPPTCITCKFPTDEEVRITPFMDFVEEEDWAGINCHNCHVMEGDQSTGQLAWLNTRTGEQEVINTPNELCNKCHVDSGVSWTGGTGTAHHIELGGTAHTNWAGMLDDTRRPEYCTDCHDPHTQEPMGCADCHPSVRTSDEHIMGNNAMHTNVDCMACHDASGAEVGPHPDEAMGGMWTTVLNSIGRTGEPTSEAIISHSVKWEVSCDRCHYAENPNELIELTAGGEIPSEEEAGGPPGGG
jgi:hypothetical protein